MLNVYLIGDPENVPQMHYVDSFLTAVGCFCSLFFNVGNVPEYPASAYVFFSEEDVKKASHLRVRDTKLMDKVFVFPREQTLFLSCKTFLENCMEKRALFESQTHEILELLTLWDKWDMYGTTYFFQECMRKDIDPTQFSYFYQKIYDGFLKDLNQKLMEEKFSWEDLNKPYSKHAVLWTCHFINRLLKKHGDNPIYDPEDLMELWKKISKYSPMTASAKFYVAMSYRIAEDGNKSYEVLKELSVNQEVRNEFIYFEEGYYWLTGNDYEKAIKYFEAALRFNPGYVPALYYLSFSQKNHNMVREALETNQKLLNLFRNFPGNFLPNSCMYYMNTAVRSSHMELMRRNNPGVALEYAIMAANAAKKIYEGADFLYIPRENLFPQKQEWIKQNFIRVFGMEYMIGKNNGTNVLELLSVLFNACNENERASKARTQEESIKRKLEKGD